MTISLAPHVHLAAIGGDVVLLDTSTDAYLCIPDGVALLRPSGDRGALSPADDDVIATLMQAGLVQSASTGVARAPLHRPTRQLGDVGVAPLTRGDLLPMAGALWDLIWRYRGRSLADIIAFVTREGAARSAATRPEVLRLARVFQRLAVWLPMPGKCLIRSFVLLRFLQRSGCGATWVFGVTTWPFRAHCWLQVGETVLDDTAERIVEYEPILGIG
jgi:hypothetical protein